MECNLKNEVCGFSCTGFDGGKIWKKLDKDIDEIDCESCRDHAKDLISFIHDLVNGGLGKPLYNEKNFNKIYHEIECVYSKISGEPS